MCHVHKLDVEPVGFHQLLSISRLKQCYAVMVIQKTSSIIRCSYSALKLYLQLYARKDVSLSYDTEQTVQNPSRLIG